MMSIVYFTINLYLQSEQNANGVIAKSPGEIADRTTQAVGVLLFASENNGFWGL